MTPLVGIHCVYKTALIRMLGLTPEYIIFNHYERNWLVAPQRMGCFTQHLRSNSVLYCWRLLSHGLTLRTNTVFRLKFSAYNARKWTDLKYPLADMFNDFKHLKTKNTDPLNVASSNSLNYWCDQKCNTRKQFPSCRQVVWSWWCTKVKQINDVINERDVTIERRGSFWPNVSFNKQKPLQRWDGDETRKSGERGLSSVWVYSYINDYLYQYLWL